ncbi:MAG: excinuclease ABC subunit UvrA [Opitutales bacterium]|nr:excinuclease ABC subunit UvrA [Opitutales bacterium]
MCQSAQHISLRGVCQNNLKGIDVDIPLGQLVVVTGLSGSGKSSLVFETLHAEGQRRYVETFSPYTRQFMDRMDRPKVDEVHNIRPSIAVEQGNTVRTSRSTVGTMTELTDYFKVWFSHHAQLIDPDSGKALVSNHPQSVWPQLLRDFKGRELVVVFSVKRPDKMAWQDILKSIQAQGYSRAWIEDKGAVQLDDLKLNAKIAELNVVQDRIQVSTKSRERALEALQTAFHFGRGTLFVIDPESGQTERFFEGLKSPVSGRSFRAATPNLFSFNSPLGACPRCRGFGRIIERDLRLIIPDTRLSLQEGAIRAFSGPVYSHALKHLLRRCKRAGVRTDVPWRDLKDSEQAFVIEGEADATGEDASANDPWYGIDGFFRWLESNTYKMHIRVFLSKYRNYMKCPDCQGARLQPESLCWRWQGQRLPDLFQLPISELKMLIESHSSATGSLQADLARDAILQRLGYLEAVGLGYLTLDRSSRTLSGGETQRVNLTSCLGASLVDTLFVLDEPSIGLHARDIDRLVRILRQLTDAGNTVVVVEHDEAVMRAADHLIEIGPKPGREGGRVVYAGPPDAFGAQADSITGAYLSGRQNIDAPAVYRKVSEKGEHGWLRLRKVDRHNLKALDCDIPLQRFVVLSGVSGSGKSTLLHDAVYAGLRAQAGQAVESIASMEQIEADSGFSEIVRVDQSPVSRTPRSNAALFVDAWDAIRKRFVMLEESRASGLTVSTFSFNTGDGRCPHCEGLGHEKIEMQFMADVYVTCPVCDGRRFRPEIQRILWNGKSVSDILEMTVDEAIVFFHKATDIHRRLKPLADVGLGYLPLGQPLNTLSGGESQRLKLVKYLAKANEKEAGHACILIDEPTTGLHRDDIKRLLAVFHALVDAGHSLVVIEHQSDVIQSADWVIELGPEAGAGGGQIVFAGTPRQLARRKTATGPYLRATFDAQKKPASARKAVAMAAESAAPYAVRPTAIEVIGAREHNLKAVNARIPHGSLTVVTGVSGSGKSTLAFDIIFAEGQRRFMESMSAWARQFVEQMPRPQIDALRGIQPTVAIEQRVTHGTRKSTTATITEVAQYLRLMFARLGIQHSLASGEPLQALSVDAVRELTRKQLTKLKKQAKFPLMLCAPLIRGRKGHHEPLAKWAEKQGYRQLRIDGEWVWLNAFQKLERFREHDIELVVARIPDQRSIPNWQRDGDNEKAVDQDPVAWALRLGKGVAFIADASAKPLFWLSTTRTDPITGEAYPDLDPKHFSWNSPRGWCPTCRGHGELHVWMENQDSYAELPNDFEAGAVCPDCQGSRLNPVSRAVYLHLSDGRKVNLPDLLRSTPEELIATLSQIETDERGRAILDELIPEIDSRLRFMKDLGLDYLGLDRATNTLSGGEAQRIRLAAQLGSNLSGSLYVLDEPSIGLHARDNERLLQSLEQLRGKGNTLLVVEHNLETMRRADQIIDLGPGAGINGGQVLASGSLDDILQHPDSITGRYLKSGIQHPVRGKYRPAPPVFKIRSPKSAEDWLCLREPRLRNLKGGQLLIPKQRLVVVCGISGAGKSTLIRDLLKPTVLAAIEQKQVRLKGKSGDSFDALIGGNSFNQVIEVDQSPIGKTPRSTPATYIGVFDRIRQAFASLPEAKMRGYSASTFSFNTKGGRCETCQGGGRVKLEMSFMPDAYVPCPDCGESRYGSELSEIRWNGKNIGDVLQMSFAEAAQFFSFNNELKARMDLMVETGLDYLTLGQSSPTLSGGEAQRLKLVSELAQNRRGNNLYILEEPTIGLHTSDCEKLIHLLHRLVDSGHTVIVIEHNLEIIPEADHLIEIGPDGGHRGGQILYQGPVSGLRKLKSSPTAPFLSRALNG